MTSSEFDSFTAALEFTLDPFQVQGCRALEQGRGVLVCAPTGAGKTVVGEFAVHLALAGGTKCFYTTPIKALSNQKHAELTARYGAHNVGLLTGDTAINSSAPVVVMTTEVLRNMLYANSPTLDGLSHVVMDEVHYLADRFRGAVWEEVILHLPQEVRLVSLSATVSNAEEFGAWIAEVRGSTEVIVDEHRPVPLWQHMLVGRRLFDLFDTKALRAAQESGQKNLVLDADLVRYVKQRESLDRSFEPGINSRTGRRTGGRGRPQATRRPIPRPDVIALLDAEGLLPAITFVFSRSGCEQALTQCLRSPVVLTDQAQADEIGRVVDKHIAEFAPADLELLGYEEWRAALLRGFAAHHAGMLPAFRHAVEELFVKGLVRAVFATETLALGINMPARTVVLERLVKYNGESHVELTPGEYTQLTGRAGRRGIDVEGHAVVLWQTGVRPQEVAGLAGARTFPLVSSFSPGYNMSINLLDRLGRLGAERLLEASFAQFQADRSVVGLAKRVERGEKELATLSAQITEAAGGADYLEYVRLREAVRARERSLRREHLADRHDGAATALAELRRGDVIAVTGGRRRGLALVVEPSGDRRDPKPVVVTESSWSGRVGASDFVGDVAVLGTLRVPKNADYRSGRGKRDLASTLRNSNIAAPRQQAKAARPAASDTQLADLRARMRAHPAHTGQRASELDRLAERYARLEREVTASAATVRATTSSLAVTFERIVALLGDRGYIETGDGESELTEAGHRLARVYSESDLLVCECIEDGVFDGLDPAGLAAVVSALVFESRGERGGMLLTGEKVPGAVRSAIRDIADRWTDIVSAEAAHRLEPSREPDIGFVAPMHQWAGGGTLAAVLLAAGERGRPLPAGDFVRWCRQVIDLLDQIKQTSFDTRPGLAAVATAAIASVRRGVVAESG
ncbi:DEAD/DEAH box helicase [Tsukamurella ocularis]|uniref:DEAD/DEAH box helicase n=1 Tax=Tsukamurella ocularis TaxID=1970234 RepID=UPI00216A1465|nr:DEAD/DEAH box helicase [Tsukamurella ocularis]MCS3779741.1 ATP-dependent RNA helicase HelY [Tsukamurella ocularis]MCS3788859.1 ATP-dependent RNA helicase HelY [Tsukamurella ocularis]MCS3850069.1 ATP-dependent RNA helicase HelY [Tsukamurella ocularis]